MPFIRFPFGCHGNQGSAKNAVLWISKRISVDYGWNWRSCIVGVFLKSTDDGRCKMNIRQTYFNWDSPKHSLNHNFYSKIYWNKPTLLLLTHAIYIYLTTGMHNYTYTNYYSWEITIYMHRSTNYMCLIKSEYNTKINAQAHLYTLCFYKLTKHKTSC